MSKMATVSSEQALVGPSPAGYIAGVGLLGFFLLWSVLFLFLAPH